MTIAPQLFERIGASTLRGTRCELAGDPYGLLAAARATGARATRRIRYGCVVGGFVETYRYRPKTNAQTQTLELASALSARAVHTSTRPSRRSARRCGHLSASPRGL